MLLGQSICDDLVSEDVLEVVSDELMEEKSRKEVYFMGQLLINKAHFDYS